MNFNRVHLPIDVLPGLLASQRITGQLHPVVQPAPLWRDPDEQHSADSTAQAALAEAGVLDHRGRIDADFLDWLPLLTAPAQERYGWFTVDGETWGVLAASRGFVGLVAICTQQYVTLTRADPRALADELVHRLPDSFPGGGSRWSVRISDLEWATAGGVHDRDLPGDAQEVLKVLQRPVEGSGELYAAERDEVGRRSRLRQPLHYVDTDWGRYLNYTRGTGADAEVIVAPATPAMLSGTLEDLWPSPERSR